MPNYRLTIHLLFLVLLTPVFLMELGCQNKSNGKGVNVGDGGDGGDLFPEGGGGDFGGGSGTDPGSIPAGGGDGSAGSIGLSDADKNALSGALNNAKSVAPPNGEDGLSAALRAEAQRLLAEEKAGRDVAVQKLVLAGKMLEECASRVAKYAPIPGQPLLGRWNGGGACAIAFDVSGGGEGGKYKVSGGTNGTLQADTSGRGGIQGDPFSGNVADSALNGKSGAGTLTHPAFFRNKSGTAPCSVAVALQQPTSPIPQNYQAGMKIAGQCFRQTLILMSPTMDKLFKGLDPAVSQLLQARFLGISK